jgi:hypothetical protein
MIIILLNLTLANLFLIANYVLTVRMGMGFYLSPKPCTNISCLLNWFTKIWQDMVHGGCSQNFLRQILKIFVTVGLNILRFYRSKVFLKQISVKMILYTIKKIKYLLFMLNWL